MGQNQTQDHFVSSVYVVAPGWQQSPRVKLRQKRDEHQEVEAAAAAAFQSM